MKYPKYLIKRTYVATEKNTGAVKAKVQWCGTWEKLEEYEDINALPLRHALNYAYNGKAAALSGLRAIRRCDRFEASFGTWTIDSEIVDVSDLYKKEFEH